MPLQSEHAQAHVHGVLVEAGYGVVRECEHNPAIIRHPSTRALVECLRKAYIHVPAGEMSLRMASQGGDYKVKAFCSAFP